MVIEVILNVRTKDGTFPLIMFYQVEEEKISRVELNHKSKRSFLMLTKMAHYG